ncbi:MAG: outer membrane lipoprotein LolB [Xanthomonadales bacterium]|nr:outer membrane lipoprotein LolB [Xanthomonadales bacterium]
MTAFLRLGVPLALVAGFLSGCAGVPERQLDRALAAQEARESQLRAVTEWGLRGRIAVHSSRQQGSGSIAWQTAPGSLRFELSAPVSRQSWVLIADADGARLQGLEEGERLGSSAGALLREAFEWEVPIESLAFWVQGARAPGKANVLLDVDGRPRQIDQDGWRIEYREWVQVDGLSLPRKVFAEQGPNRLRLVVDGWKLGPAS